MRSPGRGHEPVVAVSRHQHQLALTVPGDLYRLPQGSMLELAEFPLKFDGSRLKHSVPIIL